MSTTRRFRKPAGAVSAVFVVGALLVGGVAGASVSTRLDSGLPVVDALSQAWLEDGQTIDQAVGDAVAASPERAAEIVGAAVSLIPTLSPQAFGLNVPQGTTYVPEEGTTLAQMIERYLQTGDRPDPAATEDMVVPLYELQGLAARPQATVISVVSEDTQETPFTAGGIVFQDFPVVRTDQPVTIAVNPWSGTLVMNLVDLTFAAAEERDVEALAVQLLFDQGYEQAAQDRIVQAAIAAGADPTVVAQATAAGRATETRFIPVLVPVPGPGGILQVASPS